MPGPTFSFKEMPKFRTPEEELSFLRAHVANREKELLNAGQVENAKENSVQAVVAEYKRVPIEEVVHKKNIISEKEADKIVLRLKPEAHDSVMEELLGILITK